MKKFLLLAASTMALMAFIPEPADAQVRRGGGWGVPAAVGLGVLGAAAVGAAAYGYSDPCVRNQQVYDMYGNVVWQAVRVC
jgi:hypothetical protein